MLACHAFLLTIRLRDDTLRQRPPKKKPLSAYEAANSNAKAGPLRPTYSNLVPKLPLVCLPCQQLQLIEPGIKQGYSCVVLPEFLLLRDIFLLFFFIFLLLNFPSDVWGQSRWILFSVFSSYSSFARDCKNVMSLPFNLNCKSVKFPVVSHKVITQN